MIGLGASQAEHDIYWMTQALAQARLAQAVGEVPIGAVVVKEGQVIGVGHNTPCADHDPTGHAEIMAIRAAAVALRNHRLDGCELFVTVEPCAMCAGATLHARLSRVVYGAPEPKTGAAGSILNLFDLAPLNHHTAVQGGVMAHDCASLLREFFERRRLEHRGQRQPVREDALRPSDAQFDDLPNYPWAPHYVSDLPALKGLRLHYLDEGPPEARLTWLCLHGHPTWSYIYRKMIPIFLAAGHRVIAPDMIGFGKSDKPKRDNTHSFTWHRQILLELVERLDLCRVVVVVQDWGGLLGLTLPMTAPHRYSAALIMNTALATAEQPLEKGLLAWRDLSVKQPEFDVAHWMARANPHLSAAECAAYAAPFPDRGHRAALRAFATMVPERELADGVAVSRQARDFWRQRWLGQTMMAVGTKGLASGVPGMRDLQQSIRHCPDPVLVAQNSHFVPEHGEPIARAAVARFASP